MLARPLLQSNENPSKFLKFVVERALANEPITQNIIGCELFPHKYLNKDIADVRVTAKNLRNVLAKYYESEGREDLVTIDLPAPSPDTKIKLPAGKAYTPVFTYNPRCPAHQEYSRGLLMLSQLRLGEAERHFAKTIELQPRYAEPYLALATTYLLFPICGTWRHSTFHHVREPEGFAAWILVIRMLVAHALTLNRKWWRTHVIRGVVHSYQRRWKKARKAFDTALLLSQERTREDPWYIAYLAATGKTDEASAILRAKVKDDPNNVAVLTQYGLLMYAMRQFYDANDAFCRAGNIDPHYGPVLICQMLLLLEKEMEADDAALSVIDIVRGRMSGGLYFTGVFAFCLARRGKTREARGHLHLLLVEDMAPFQLALAHLGLGEIDEALLRLKFAGFQYNPLLLWIHLWPVFDPLRNHPQFQLLIRRMKLPASNYI
jgi:tetratricopeptide (TPR) repeat protein